MEQFGIKAKGGLSKMSDKLKPCPFCGGEVAIKQIHDDENKGNNSFWYVFCHNNNCTVQPNTRHWDSTPKNRAIKAWNTRTGDKEC